MAVAAVFMFIFLSAIAVLCNPLLAIIIYVISVVMRALHMLISKRKIKLETSPSPGGQPVKTMVVLGSGGHTAEMLGLLSSLDFSRFTPRMYVRARSDTTSGSRVENLEMERAAGIVSQTITA